MRLKSVNLQRSYDNAAFGIDDFVRNNPDAFICFSAGNNNEIMQAKPSIGSQAAAKDCLTVGASGSTRILQQDGRFNRLDPDEVLPDSSRGPTKEHRVKPDVVAPGFNIFSTQSRHAKSSAYKRARAFSDRYPDTLWTSRSGTTHATPLVSGCVAILREILQSRGCQNPPAALLKAVIINGADKLPDVDVAAQGFGRVNLQASTAMLDFVLISTEQMPPGFSLSSMSGTLIGEGLRQDEVFMLTLAPTENLVNELNGSSKEFKITMVYNDIPGGKIQKNLNLAVIDPSTGEIKHGNISEDDICWE